jgi:hypothetical protein
VKRGFPQLGEEGRSVEDLDVQMDADLLEGPPNGRQEGSEQIAGQRQHAPARRDVASTVTVRVVLRLRHLRPGQPNASGVPRCSVRVVVEEQVVLQAVQSEMPRRPAGSRSPGRLDHPLLVYDQVGGLADVDVVERRLRHVHDQGPHEVTGALDEPTQIRVVLEVPHDPG